MYKSRQGKRKLIGKISIQIVIVSFVPQYLLEAGCLHAHLLRIDKKDKKGIAIEEIMKRKTMNLETSIQ